MKPTKTHAAMFLVAAAAGAALSAPQHASAWAVRSHASRCMTLGGTPIDNAWAIQNDSTSSMKVLCPVYDADTNLKQNTTAMKVHGFDGSGTYAVTAQACTSNAFSEWGACQAGMNSSAENTGDYDLAIPTNTAWTAAKVNDFGFIVVTVPPKQGAASRSSLRGFFQQGT